ncbi:Ephrin type-B receptor 3 (Fragment) [Seminavis robusta]|uniref:Guanylate cyclase n=1 Tax=Seminavis robusta TaxID=568900 RepID=A0A9N8EUK6_9STRA
MAEESTATLGTEHNGFLKTLRALDGYRKVAPQDFVRAEATEKSREDRTNSNVDLFTLPDGSDKEIAVCHISSIMPLNFAPFRPWRTTHEDVAVIAMAVAHLNSGDGSIVPEVEGLNDRCNVRFTAEMTDSMFQGGQVVNQVVDQVNREPSSEKPIPCAFLGAYSSAVSVPMSIVTGLFGYPQVSGFSTSPELDDSSQYPMFARSIPGDDGNAVPVIIYLTTVLKLEHVAVVNVNDAYGNAYVEGLRKARDEYAPDLTIQQIPLDGAEDKEVAAKAAVQSLKVLEYRYIFMLAYSTDMFDAVILEAYNEGMAGTGKHNWMFADSFSGSTARRTFEPGSPLSLAYQGTGYFQVTAGIRGRTIQYDKFRSKAAALNNPDDMDYVASLLPGFGPEKPFVDDPTFLNPIAGASGPFMYDATIAVGLAACKASESHGLNFTGRQHFDSLLGTQYLGATGRVDFDPVTGTRDPSTATYRLVNLIQTPKVDRESGVEAIGFNDSLSSVFQDGNWTEIQPYVFNDNTTNVQPDLPPPPVIAESGNDNLALAIAIPVTVALILAVIVFLFYENKRKKSDAMFVIKEDELKFSDPPEIIGRGTFGVVLLAELKGTEVAVKRVLPPLKSSKISSQFGSKVGKSSMTEKFEMSTNEISMSRESGISHMSGQSSASTGTGTAGDAGSWHKMKKDFLKEIQLLAKLRHPCITLTLGAVTAGEPMLIMEYMDHGSLYDILHNETMALDGDMVLDLLSDITRGVRFLHASDPPLIHGDLKSSNCLVDSRMRAKICDFGLSQKKQLGGTGTPAWMAPELLRFESGNTKETDVYSFGVLLYEVISRRDPYEGEKDMKKVLRLVADKTVQKRPEPPRHMPEPMKAVMRDCLEDGPHMRPSFDEIDNRLKRMDVETLGSVTSKHSNKKGSNSVSIFDIFPRHIAEALRDGRTVEPEHKDSVTIFFSDIVGFTTISTELEPRKVADMLDRLYTKFDALSAKWDVFKVETIGDAYMAVTNLIKDQPDCHANRIAEFSKEAIVAANETYIDEEAPDKGFIEIRVGFHSGPVVADVVGTRNPRYCLFGDSVNCASRMESNSKKNRIHCSDASAKLLKKQHPTLPLKSRGSVHIKGKGDMHTYWVNEAAGTDTGGNMASKKDALPLVLDSSTHSATLSSVSTHEVAGAVPPESSPELGENQALDLEVGEQPMRQTAGKAAIEIEV